MPFITVTYPPKYPLTGSEKKWIERRESMEEKTGVFFCHYCKHLTEYYDEWIGYCDGMPCPVYPEELEAAMWKDAAEFEARTAAKLANRCRNTRPCTGEPCKECEARRLKQARLAVEEEMERTE